MRYIWVMLLVLSGCGSTTRVGFVSNLGGASVNGLVSIVHISVTSGESGTSIIVTAVTLVNGGTASNVIFCGDQRDQFPINQTVTATFNPGTTCGTLVSVKSP